MISNKKKRKTLVDFTYFTKLLFSHENVEKAVKRVKKVPSIFGQHFK